MSHAPAFGAEALAWVVLATACIGDPVDPELTPADREALTQFVSHERPSGVIGHEASFGDSPSDPRVELVGYLLEPRTLTQVAGETFTITFVWRAVQPPPGGFRLFTHLVDERGRLLANLDTRGMLRSTASHGRVRFPPSRWPTQVYIRDSVEVSLPKHTPSRVQLRVGFYRGDTRLLPQGNGTDRPHAAAVIPLNTTGRGSRTVPELQVPRLSEGVSINIDGTLDEAAWAKAARTGAFVSPSTGDPSKVSPVQGSARLMYDESHFYVAFEVRDRDLRGGFEEGAHDAHLWTRDTIEIMIDPDGDGDNKDYYEIQISPQNLVFDARFDGYNIPRGGPDGPFGHEQWSAHAQSAVVLDGTLDDATDIDGGYVVEARIPFRAFGRAKRSPPLPGDRWRANFYAMQNNGGVAWSPLLGEGNFHRASRFGKLLWSERSIP